MAGAGQTMPTGQGVTMKRTLLYLSNKQAGPFTHATLLVVCYLLTCIL
jgi:hypothetical protein